MLIDFEYYKKKKTLDVSFIDSKGNLKINKYNFKAFNWVECSEIDKDRDAKFHTWDGNYVKKESTDYPNKHTLRYFIDDLPDEEKNEILSYADPTPYSFDIETEITSDGYSQPKDAKNKIISIAFTAKNKCIVLGLKDLTNLQINSIENKINKHVDEFGVKYMFTYMKFNSEEDMLMTAIQKMQSFGLIIGWNVLEYDFCYLYNRCVRLKLPYEKLSPSGGLYKTTLNKKKGTFTYLPKHKLIVDYMDLFKKWGDSYIKIKESFSLDFISETLLKKKKVEYHSKNINNLRDLYELDFENFIFYNAIDTILVQIIDRKTKLLSIMYGIATLANVEVSKSLSAVNVTESLLRKPLRDKYNIVYVKSVDKDLDEEKLKGGFVAEANIGYHEWLVTLDFASLYPTTMREMMIAPENYKGKTKDRLISTFNGKRFNLDMNNDIITAFDTVFSKAESSTINIITDMFAQRKSYKGDMKKAKGELDTIKKYYELRFNKKLIS